MFLLKIVTLVLFIIELAWLMEFVYPMRDSQYLWPLCLLVKNEEG